MISVQNHQLQLNGNKWLIILIAVITVSLTNYSCGTSRKAHRGNNRSEISITPEKNPPSEEEKSRSLDTVNWMEITDEMSTPITSPVKEDLRTRSQLKSVYNVALMAPFRAENINNGAEIINGYKRFIDYYLGMQLAAKVLTAEGVSMNIKVFDTEYSEETMNSILKDPFLSVCDVIIGPYRRSNVRSTIEMAKENSMTLVSPWISSNTLTSQNPYYVQLKPSLTRHYEALRDHMISSELVNKVVFVAKEGDEERWQDLEFIFNARKDIESNKPLFSDTLWVSPDSLGPESTVFVNLMDSLENPVLFIPYPSSQDEDYVYTLLRKLNIDKGEKEVVVYGPGTWVDYKDAVLDLFNTLDIRLSISNLFQTVDDKYQALKISYFKDYGTIMTSDAAEGFDTMYFIGHSLNEKGTYFHAFPEEQPWLLNQTGFHIKPVYNDLVDTGSSVEFYENFYIQIMEYKDFQFIKIP